MRPKYTFEQIKILEKYREKRRKRSQVFMNHLWNKLKYIFNWLMLGLEILIILFISVLAGTASEPLIYRLNMPFGLGYAHYASYAETALIMIILYGYIINTKKSK